ncbi:MAG: hypothetical protein NUW24_00015 [Anaerolineae bacterium]|nr:hypothetical protein [Anaerolineae bacterium]MDH7472764.1 hypothetical protein [Anaerolineae bacterium]
MPISSFTARELANRAYDVGASVLRGPLTIAEEGLTVGETDILEWLKGHVGQEVILIAASIGEDEGRRRTCRICGREYEGLECPHCREIRLRLRGGR